MLGSAGVIRRRTTLLVAAALGALAFVFVLRAADGREYFPQKPSADPAVRLVLRVQDLPPGYGTIHPFQDDGPSQPDLLCAALDPGEPQPKVTAFVEEYAPQGCMTFYSRAFTVPGGTPAPLLVGSAALDPRSVKSAQAAVGLAPEILSHLLGDELPTEAVPAQTLGEETRLFHGSTKRVLGTLPALRAASILVWRSGGVAAAIFATGRSLAQADSAALTLAQRQQAHIENPTPYTPADRYVTDLLLDSPKLTTPVLWLGRSFRPGHGFGPAALRQALIPPYAPRGESTFLLYRRNIIIDSWDQRSWDPVRNNAWGARWRCTKSRRIDLPEGTAVLYAAYRENFTTCPRRRPDHYSALLHSHGMAIVIDVNVRGKRAGAKGEYDSFAGLATIARSLHLRPHPDY